MTPPPFHTYNVHFQFLSDNNVSICWSGIHNMEDFLFLFVYHVHYVLFVSKASVKVPQRGVNDPWHLFVSLGFIVPLKNFSLTLRHHHYWWRAANFDLCSTLLTNKQLEFFSVPHLLWHVASVYNGRLWGPVTLTPIAKHLAAELSLPVFTT